MVMNKIKIKDWKKPRMGEPWEIEIAKGTTVWDSPLEGYEYFDIFWDLIVMESLYAAEFKILYDLFEKYGRITFFCERKIDIDHAKALRAFLIARKERLGV